jgi:protein-disulfide isomerase
MIAVLMVAVSGLARAGDTSVLHPPKGSKVAIIAFEDLECPQCAHIEPRLEDAVREYKIPLVRYDFTLPQHPWSFEAHVTARYFETKSKELGEEYRSWVFANQNFITKMNVRGMSERFATEHHVALPVIIDPNGSLAAKVNADKAIGEKLGIDHTPTIYVVGESRQTPYIEVKDISQLFNTIDQMKALVQAEAPAPKSKKKSAVPTGEPLVPRNGPANAIANARPLGDGRASIAALLYNPI